jgi:hypothetical protein
MRIQSGDKKLLNKKDPLGVVRFGGFEPIDISGCVLWLRSDMGITKDGGNLVSAWADQSGNGNDAIQAVAGNQPLWIDAQINGHPAIYSAAGDESMKGNISGISNSFTAFFVANFHGFNHLTPTGFGSLIGAGQANDSDNISSVTFYHNSATSLMAYSLGVGPSVTPVNADAWTLLEYKWNGDVSQIAYKNGVQTDAAAIDKDISPATYILFARWVGGIPSNFEQDYFAEVIIYNSALSDSNRQLVETYLNGRYAIY